MDLILLTKGTGPIGWIAGILGLIMNGIFTVIDYIGIPNIGLAIILFTIVVNLLMLPLTIKQQKFSKLSAKMNPELQAITAKYKGKKDQESMMAQSAEMQAVHAKYGVSQGGTCVQLLIQILILLALYNVIRAIPAYVTTIGDTFRVLASNIIEKEIDGEMSFINGESFLQKPVFNGETVNTITNTVKMYGKAMTNGNVSNGIVDVLNKLSSSDMKIISEHYGLADLTTAQGELILSNENTRGLIDTYNNFLGLNMGDSPWNLITSAMAVGAVGIVIGAAMIPLLSAVTQWINVKLMPQQENKGDDQASAMMQSMKTMNMFMPLMSAWLCFTLPAGMGLYWITGSVVRGIQQVVINKYFDRVNFDDIIKKNSVKSAKKIEKMKEAQERMNAYATMSTRNIQSRANIPSSLTDKEKENAAEQTENYRGSSNVKPGSMMAKANMVKQYNEKKNSSKEEK